MAHLHRTCITGPKAAYRIFLDQTCLQTGSLSKRRCRTWLGKPTETPFNDHCNRYLSVEIK